MSTHIVIRIEEAGLGPESQVRLVLSGSDDLQALHRPWASSGATIERVEGRMRATTTVEALARAAGRTLGAEAARDLDRVLREAVASWAGPAPAVRLPGGAALPSDQRPLVVGVVNVTPDSFSDGGALYPDGHPETAIAYARDLVEQGADVLDVGGESTRPGAKEVTETEELARVLPVLEGLSGTDIPISVDTRKAKVAAAAVAAGAVVVNDVSGAGDTDLLEAVAETDAAYVLMHTRGTPADMQTKATYDDVVAEVYEFLADGIGRCVDAGIDLERIVVDPGFGFAKSAEHNLQLLGALRQFRGLGRPVLVGASRKSFLGAVVESDDPLGRFAPSLACAVLAVASGAALVRVHDVAATVEAVKTTHAVASAGTAHLPQR